MMIQMFQKMKTKYMQKYKELSFFISLFNFDKKRENTWSTVRSAMRTFVAVVLERITTKGIAFAMFNVNNTFNPSHTLISKSLCDKNRQLCENR